MNPIFQSPTHKSSILQALDKHEIDDRCGSNTAKNCHEIFHSWFIIEGKQHTGKILHQSSKEKGNSYGNKDCQNNG